MWLILSMSFTQCILVNAQYLMPLHQPTTRLLMTMTMVTNWIDISWMSREGERVNLHLGTPIVLWQWVGLMEHLLLRLWWRWVSDIYRWDPVVKRVSNRTRTSHAQCSSTSFQKIKVILLCSMHSTCTAKEEACV